MVEEDLKRVVHHGMRHDLSRFGMVASGSLGVVNTMNFFHSPLPIAAVALTCAIALHRESRKPLSYEATDLPSMAQAWGFIRKIRNVLYGSVTVLSGTMAALYCTNGLTDANALMKSYIIACYVASMTTSLTHLIHRKFSYAIGRDSSVATFKGIDNITP